MRRMTYLALVLLAALFTGCTASRPISLTVRPMSMVRRLGEPIQIVLDSRAPPYLIGKTLNLPQPIEGDFTRLVSIPSWTCRGGVTCSPCNDVAECDVMPPVEPGLTLLVEEGWIDEPSGRIIVRVVSAYVSR
jgi:hypothetical protein